MQAPTLISTPPQNGVGEAVAEIAVAVLTFPEMCTVLFSGVCGNALEAGLRRQSVQLNKHGSFFQSIFTVSVLTVPRELSGQAVKSIKATLNELQLQDRATIATKTADGSWLSIHGLDLGGINFDKAFLRLEDIKECRANVEKYKMNSALALRTLIATLKTSAAAKGENPEAK